MSPEQKPPTAPTPPPLAPSDFAKQLLNQVVGITENPNNLSSERVLQLVRQGVQKPGFMEEYLKSGGKPPQYSVLSDSEYMDAYRTDQVPNKRATQPDDPTPEPTPPDNDQVPFLPPVVPDQVPFLPPAGQPSMPGDPNGPNYQNSLGPNRTDGLNPATGQPYPDFNFLKTLSNMGMQQQNGYSPSLPSRPVSPPSVSEDLLQGNFQSPLPMYSSLPAQQGYNYSPDVMAKLLQQLRSTQV